MMNDCSGICQVKTVHIEGVSVSTTTLHATDVECVVYIEILECDMMDFGTLSKPHGLEMFLCNSCE